MLNLVLAATSSDPTTLLYGYGPLGVAVVAESIAIYRLWRALQSKDAKIEVLNEDRVKRERELSTNTLPVLAETARVMSTVPPAIEHALAEVADSSRAERVESLIARLERAARSASPEA